MPNTMYVVKKDESGFVDLLFTDGSGNTVYKVLDTTAVSSTVTSYLSTLINVPNGLVGTDGDGKIAAAQLPSYVDDVLEFANVASFPATGESGKIYVDLTDDTSWYRWGGSAYIQIKGSPGSTDAVAEGTLNLYFTIARAQAAVTSVTGNAGTATKLATARTISIAGGAVGSASFDGSGDITINVTVSDDSLEPFLLMGA